MRKTVILFVSLLMMSTLIGGCGEKTQDNDTGKEMELYGKVKNLTAMYIDSLRRCDKDSATVNRLMEAYEKKLEEINMSVPRGTDMHLTPEYNDTIYALVGKLLSARDKALSAPNDSIAADSVAADTIKANRTTSKSSR